MLTKFHGARDVSRNIAQRELKTDHGRILQDVFLWENKSLMVFQITNSAWSQRNIFSQSLHFFPTELPQESNEHQSERKINLKILEIHFKIFAQQK